MVNAMNKHLRTSRRITVPETGFTLIEVMISMVILMVGLLMILALFAKGLSATQYAQQDLIAKQKAREQLEAIYASRNDSRVAWNQIQGTPTGIYLTGFQPLYAVNPSSTDIMGTTFHTAALDTFVTRDPGGNFQFVQLTSPKWQRRVEIINDPNDTNLRMITVTVRVQAPGLGARNYVVQGEIANGQ